MIFENKDIKKKSKGDLYLIITNISKSPNIKSLIKSAVAFGAQTIFVAGQKKFNFNHEDQDSDIPSNMKPLMAAGLLNIVRFEKLEECVDHVHSLGIKIVGVEIDESAVDLDDEANKNYNADDNKSFSSSLFEGDTAFMMGNEGDGMNKKQMDLCDRFVKIKQFGGGTASLNVSVAAGIALHRFHHWANE